MAVGRWRRLAVGDYLVGRAVVERKSVEDLHLAIIKGRFWPQIGRLTRTSRPLLLVEGPDLDAGPLRPESVRGALLAVDELGVGIIRSSGPADSALWLKLLADRASRVRGRTRTYARPTRDAAEAMLTAVPGISVVTARALLARFGSVSAVVEAGPAQWLSTPDVGPIRAQRLSETLARRERHV